MKKILFVTHNGRFLVQFELNDIQLLQNMGYEVHCATNFKGETMRSDAEQTLKSMQVVCHQIDIERSPTKLTQNLRAYFQLKKLMKQERYAAVHCHTPMGGVVGRLAARAAHIRPVLYTAHGFHFYKGCPMKNRLIYQTVEAFMARWTDALITINHEDYEAASKFRMRGQAYYIPGIGVDVARIADEEVDIGKERDKLGIPRDAVVFISVGELNKNKNHETAIRAFANTGLSDAYYLICGEGELHEELQQLINQLGLNQRVRLLGFRSDVYRLLHASDVCVFPSLREGLPVALMEAMAAGLPCIATRIRGNTDLLGENYEYLTEPANVESHRNKMEMLLKSRSKAARYCRDRIGAFDVHVVQKKMADIYSSALEK